MITHPFIGDLSNLTIDELGNKIAELNKRLSWASRTNNSVLINQLHMILASYRAEYNTKQAQLWNKSTTDFKPNIDIS